MRFRRLRYTLMCLAMAQHAAMVLSHAGVDAFVGQAVFLVRDAPKGKTVDGLID